MNGPRPRLIRRPSRGLALLCAAMLATTCAATEAAPPWWNKLRGNAGAEPLPPERAFGVTAQWADATTVRVTFDVMPHYYLYKERTTIVLKDSPGRRLVSVRYPPAVNKNDPNFGPMAVYPKPFDVDVRVDGPASNPVSLLVRYQGCYETIGVCYPPTTVTVQPR